MASPRWGNVHFAVLHCTRGAPGSPAGRDDKGLPSKKPGTKLICYFHVRNRSRDDPPQTQHLLGDRRPTAA